LEQTVFEILQPNDGGYVRTNAGGYQTCSIIVDLLAASQSIVYRCP